MSATWTKEDYLDGTYTMARLQHLAEFEKEYLLGMIQSDLNEGTELVLKDLRRVSAIACKTYQDYGDSNPMEAEEMAMEAATWGMEPQHDPDDWTQEEINLVNRWWDKTFPGEDNPLYLYPTEPDEEYPDEEL